ncbi:1-acyl-sn-glycerol-3-phosphate acyltransferase 2 [Candida viswanathii]|uniref:1-acyl-sn-glycerol-3-phosphate acyltransferase 2 n=1 Tax=Candida viswanathii TaxID=5486 RepID=A0A367XW53_9ASCO|nr:1-acyl-sn-glycerol-3-phosphate acyltransferase 2 [Candida viswanathii]
MEFVDHLGIRLEKELEVQYLFVWVKGLLCLSALFVYILCYQVVAVICTIASVVIPDSANMFRNTCGNFFWDLGLYFMHLNKVKFRIFGDKMDASPAIVISNHASLADCFVIQYLSRISVLGDGFNPLQPREQFALPIINFFSWFLVWRVPTIKILLHMLKCDENWELEEKSLSFVFSRLLKSKFSEWVVLFPEVNIWSSTGATLQREVSEKYYLPKFDNLLYPRYSAFYNVISALEQWRPHPYVNLYDVTIVYYRQPDANGIRNYSPPTLLEIFACSEPITVIVYVKIRPVSRIPEQRKKLEKYLEHLWKHKEKVIAELKSENTASQVQLRVRDNFTAGLGKPPT